MAAVDEETSLIMPGEEPSEDAAVAELPLGWVWLRNPKTGVIHKLFHDDPKFKRPSQNDTIARCLKEGYTVSSEAAAKKQAVELAQLQGREAPAWASTQSSMTAPAEPGESTADARAQNEAARSKRG